MTPEPTIEPFRELIGTSSTDAAFEKRIRAVGLNPNTLVADEHLASILDNGLGLEIALKDMAMFNPEKHSALSGVWVIDGVHFHSTGHEGFAAYKGPLPLGVKFGMRRAEVRSQAGIPAASGGGKASRSGLTFQPWDSYRLSDDVLVRIQYDWGDQVQMVTMFRAEGERSVRTDMNTTTQSGF